MTLTIDIQPEMERSLLARAQARGVSLVDFAREVLAREVSSTEPTDVRTGQELIDASARMRGVLSDEEIDELFRRSSSLSRPVDFS